MRIHIFRHSELAVDPSLHEDAKTVHDEDRVASLDTDIANVNAERSGPRRERQVLRLRLVVRSRVEVDHVWVLHSAGVPPHRANREDRVCGQTTLVRYEKNDV